MRHLASGPACLAPLIASHSDVALDVRQEILAWGSHCRWSRAEPDIALDRCDDQRQGSEYNEYRITRQPQPLDQVRTLAPDILHAARVPVSVLNHVPDLQHSTREQAHCHHHRQADIGAPESDLDVLLDACPACFIAGLTKHEHHKCDPQHAEDAHQRGMSMVGGQQGVAM
jgi:hypothetical protein